LACHARPPSIPTRRSSDLRDRPRDEDAGPDEPLPAERLVHDQRHRDADHDLDRDADDGEERGVVEGVPEARAGLAGEHRRIAVEDRKSTRLNSSHVKISYA